MAFPGPEGHAGSPCHAAGGNLGRKRASTLLRAENQCLAYPLAFYEL